MYEYEPHPRVAERDKTGAPKTRETAKALHGGSFLGRLNGKIGLRVTLIVGTMWAAYAFTVISLISLPSAIKSHDALVIVSWIAQTFIQLVLLPVIIVGQNIQSASSDARSKATFDDSTAILHETKQLQAHLKAQDEHLRVIAAKLGVDLDAVPGTAG